MKTVLGFIAILLLSTGCASNPLCPVVTLVSTSAATTVAAQCGCDEAAVYSSMYPVLNVGGMCKAGGAIASVVCPFAGQELASLLGGTFPSAWKCTAAASCVGTVIAPLVAACQTLPFAPAP